MRLGHDRYGRLLAGLAAVFALALLVLAVALGMGARQEESARITSSRTLPLVAKPPPERPTVSQSATPTLSLHGAGLDAYEGLASWVDVYDTPAWRDPSAAVEDMARHGVRTLFVQTSHYNSPGPFFNAKALRKFITEGHAQGMRVVAWYLPNMKPGSVDYIRFAAAVNFRAADGQAFDSFALDIESSAIQSESMRNRGLKSLSLKMRKLVGPSYPLGAIIPEPIALRRENGVWHNFPYTMLADNYDVFMPMGYYTFHGHGAQTAYIDTRANIKILRSQRGCAQVPIHLIGGIAENSSAGQIQAFAKAACEDKCLGASIYGWAGTGPAGWRALRTIKP